LVLNNHGAEAQHLIYPAAWRKNLKTKAYIFDSLKKIAEREKGIKTLSATPPPQ
jgi:hypothetical protein